MNYAKQIKEIEAEISRRWDCFQKDIAPLSEAAEALKKMNTVCLRCEGTGKIRVCDAAGDFETEICPMCGKQP